MHGYRGGLRPKRMYSLSALLLFSHLVAAAAPNNSTEGASASPTLRWWTLDAGGGPIANLGIELDASVGQPDVRDDLVLQAGALQLRPGYWGPTDASPAAAIFSDGFEAAN